MYNIMPSLPKVSVEEVLLFAKSSATQSWIIFSICLVGGFLNFIPYICGYTLMNKDGSFPDYIEELQSRNLHDALVASVGTVVPVLLDILLRPMLKLPNLRRHVPRRELIALLIIPDILLITYILPYRQYDVMPGLFGLQDTLIMYVICSNMRALEPNVWNLRSIAFICGPLISANVICSFQLVSVNEHEMYCYMITRMVLVSIAILMLVYCVFRWMRHCAQIGASNGVVEARVCSVYIFACVVFVLVDWMPSFFPHVSPSWYASIGSSYLTLYTYMFACMSVILTITTTNFVRLEAHESEVL